MLIPLKIRREELKSNFGVKTLCCLAIAIALLQLSGVSGWAHKLNVFAYVEGDTVVVEGYFSGNVKAQDSLVQVFDSGGKKILEGKTDSKGMYFFKLAELLPVKGDIRIVLDGGMGHRADFTLTASDLPTTFQESQTTQLKSKEEVTGAPSLAANPSMKVQDISEVKKVFEQTLDQRIQPLVNMLGNQQKILMEQREKSPTIAEIIGGIGWIIGIVGVAGYFVGRRRKPGN